MTPRFIRLENKPACLIIPEPSHVDLFLKLQNEIESRQYFERFWPIGRDQELEWIAKANTTPNHAVFTIATYPSLTPVGSIGLREINWKDRRATLGIGILEEYCNKGLGSTAVMLLLSWAFLELGLNKIEWRAYDDNDRSVACCKKCGGQEVVRFKQHYYRKGGWYSQVVLEIFASNWRPLWAKFTKETPRAK